MLYYGKGEPALHALYALYHGLKGAKRNKSFFDNTPEL